MKRNKYTSQLGLSDGKIDIDDFAAAANEGIDVAARGLSRAVGVSNREYLRNWEKWEFAVKALGIVAIAGTAYGITKLVSD